MRKLTLATILCLIPLSAGCAMSNTTPVTGFAYNGAKGTHGATANPVGAKTGESCASSILGIIGIGDASAASAAAAGGVSKISTVDTKTMAVLGIYAKSCTVVSGE